MNAHIWYQKTTMKVFYTVFQKHQFLKNFLMKMAVSQAESRETARTVREPTGFPNKSSLLVSVVVLVIVSIILIGDADRNCAGV